MVQRSQKQIRGVGWRQVWQVLWGPSAPTFLHLFLANDKVSIWSYSSLHDAKLVSTAGSAGTVFHSHRQGTDHNKTEATAFILNIETVQTFLKVQELSHSQEIQYHRRRLMNICKPNSCCICTTLCLYDNTGRRRLEISWYFNKSYTEISFPWISYMYLEQ